MAPLSGTVSNLNRDGRRPSYDGDVLVVLSLRGVSTGTTRSFLLGTRIISSLAPTSESQAMPLLGLDSMFGLHPAMAPLMPFGAGQFGAVHAVGQPAPTRSHFEATGDGTRSSQLIDFEPAGWIGHWACGRLARVQAVQPETHRHSPRPVPTRSLALGSPGDFTSPGWDLTTIPQAAPDLARGQRRWRCTTVRQPRSQN